ATVVASSSPRSARTAAATGSPTPGLSAEIPASRGSRRSSTVSRMRSRVSGCVLESRRRTEMSTSPRMWILGAPDPEMELIESILRARGERVEYATVWRDGVRRRVTPAEAYAPDVEIGEGLRGLRATAYMVECAPAVL